MIQVIIALILGLLVVFIIVEMTNLVQLLSKLKDKSECDKQIQNKGFYFQGNWYNSDYFHLENGKIKNNDKLQ